MRWIVELNSGEKWKFDEYAEVYFFLYENIGFPIDDSIKIYCIKD